MPIDNDKYYYVNRVGLLKNSWAHQRLEQDMLQSHMVELPGKLVAIRITEYYRLVDRIERMFRTNPAAAAMLLSVGGVASNDEAEPPEETRATVAPSNGNGKKPATPPVVSKPLWDEEDEEAEPPPLSPEQNEFAGAVESQWDM